jgi:hypothetical protein
MEGFNMKAGSYPEGIRCRHKATPSEPFAKEREFGYIIRITPASRGIPAQAFVQWDEYTTWEKLQDLTF